MRSRTTRGPAVAEYVVPASRRERFVPEWASSCHGVARATSECISTFVDHVNAGRYRLPAFQRPWRWSDADVIELLTSLFRGGYVGTLLVWERYGLADSVEHFGEHEVLCGSKSARLVVDGQQRIGALMTAVHSGRFFFDLLTGTFIVGQPDALLCPVGQMIGFDLGSGTNCMFWHEEHALRYKMSPERVRDLWICAHETIRDAEIHMCVLDSGWLLRDVVETYRRLNTTGLKMSVKDLEAGLKAVENM